MTRKRRSELPTTIPALIAGSLTLFLAGCGGNTSARDLPKEFACATVSSRVHFGPDSVGVSSPRAAADSQLPDSVDVISVPIQPKKSTHEIEYFAYRDEKLVAEVRVVKLPGNAGFRASASERCTSESVG